MADFAREAALDILHKLDQHHLTLDTIINDFTESKKHMEKRDLSLIYALVFGVVRWKLHLDHIISHYSKSPVDKINPDIMNILRLGIYQLKFMTKIPPSAAVNTSVELSKKNGPVWVVKFVNGVLRNASRSLESVPFPDPQENQTLFLSLTQSFPTWLVQRWLDRFGDEKTLQLCQRINTIPEISVRTNTLKTDRATLTESLKPLVKDLAATPCACDGLSFTHPSLPIHSMPPFKQGWFQVQDEAAQMVSEIMAPLPGERILDACAGLGGKSGHMAQLMKNQGEIIAVDHDRHKLDCLELEMKRLAVSVVKTIQINLDEPFNHDKIGLFDRILVDAPCSGMGVIRRNPDSKWNLSKKNLNRFNKRQVRFLSVVSEFLKPEGVLVYAVCSTEPEENEGVVDSFLHKHPGFMVVQNTNHTNEKAEFLRTPKGFYMSLPHVHGMDGFFIACLKRRNG